MDKNTILTLNKTTKQLRIHDISSDKADIYVQKNI